MKPISFFIVFLSSINVFAFNCEGRAVAQLLNRLTDVGRLHNCKIEVLKLENTLPDANGDAKDIVSFLVYGKDLFRCKTTDRVCPQANFEVTVLKSCLLQPKAITEVETYSSGYNLDGRKRRNHIQIKQNGHLDTVQIAFGQTDLESVERINYVSCRLNPLAGEF